jgi:formiminoglutamase
VSLPHDPLWPRASSLFSEKESSHSDAILVGIPAHQRSISSTNAHQTPAAIRESLQRYSLAHSNPAVRLEDLQIWDAGDLTNPDVDEAKTIDEVRNHARKSRLFVAIGGDNSITFSVAQGIGARGLITFDAHYDLRDGESNGSPVRRLIEAGLSGTRVVQIGIAEFSNSPAYAERARKYGITVIHRSELRKFSCGEIWKRALDIAGDQLHVDFDIDVCDRSVVPACPAAAPGGISADEIRQFAFLAGASSQVRSIDITEIDASKDAADQRTIRLGALVVLEALAGLTTRRVTP